MESNCKRRSKATATAVVPAEKEDRLGALPDEIVCCILSFLPVRHAIRTSILSSRWKDLYLGIPNINLAIALERCWLQLSEIFTTYKKKIKDIEEKFETLAEQLNMLSETLAQAEEDNEGRDESGEDEETENEEAPDDEDGDVSVESQDDDAEEREHSEESGSGSG